MISEGFSCIYAIPLLQYYQKGKLKTKITAIN